MSNNLPANKEFCLNLLGDVDLQGMTIIVCNDDQTIAEINYEKGIDHMEIELLPNPEIPAIPLDDFFAVLQKAEQLAVKCAKEDEELRKQGVDM